MLAPVTVLDYKLSIGDSNSPILLQSEALKIIGRLPDLTYYKKGSGIPPKFMGGSQQQVFDQFSDLCSDLDVKEIIIKDFLSDNELRKRSYHLIADFKN